MPAPNLAEILSKISDGLSVFDKDLGVTFVNEKAASILEAADEAFHNRLVQTLKDHAPIRFDHFHTSISRWFEHQTYPNADGGFTLFSRDITSRRRLEDALRASEERFRRLMESNIIGVLVVQSGIITEANDVFLKMIGSTRADLVSQQLRWREITPQECDAPDASARHEITADGVFAPYEKEFIRKDGSRVPVLIGGVATQNDPVETLCLAVDLSERRRAEDRMRNLVECGKILASSLECERTFTELAEYLVSKVADSCLIFVKDEDDTLIRMAAAQRTPIPASRPGDPDREDIGRIMSTAKPEMVVSPTSCVLMPIITRNDVAGVLAVASSKPVAFDSDDLHFFSVIGRRAGLALDNARLYHEAQRANRLKDEFVAIVSHELRTPLTPILGGVYMLRSEPEDPKVFAHALELIERNAKTQVKIVDDLLDISRALSGKLRLNMEPVDLAAIIQAALETVRPASEAKNIRIDLQLGTLEGIVSGDADRLQQVVWNLLANSVKFTPNGGRILVKLSQVQSHAEIGVVDTGIGIEAEFLPHVFERFRQADASRTRLHGGLGLGLAIVRHLVESHGGTVHAHSSGGEQGSTFIVKLPLRAAAKAAQL
jgi:PAS domain S-box-containing protein